MVIMGSRGVCIVLFLLLAVVPSLTALVSVMSVDLGSEWMKIAIVKPGVPMEIALNKESRRKTPTAVCLREDERLFGDSALAVSNPKLVYRHLQSLLGKKHDNPQVALFQRRFPEHRLLEDPTRGTVYFKNNNNNAKELPQYTPVELLGMVLNYSRGLAQDFAETTIRDAVVTVPAFFNQAERRAVLQAAETAGLRVLQLINDNTAVALNYGVLRRKDINSTAKNIMFYDMGAGSTTATVVTYQTTSAGSTKNAGVATWPQMRIRGVGFDRTLGGFEMDLRLRDHLARVFNSQGKSKKDVRENPRAMAKLLQEAQRIKMVLSANADHMAEVEGLMDDVDFRAKVSRAEFETLCADLFERVPRPVQDALASAEMTLDELDQVILVGGATRVPKVQDVLLKAVGKAELSKNINADEAAAMGAVYQAAVLSKSFKVKPFLVQEAAVFPVQVEYTQETEEDGTKSLKHNRHILFQRMAPYPQRKVVTFNHYTDDFAFNINYGDLSFFGQEDRAMFGSPNLTTVKLSGVGSRFQEHPDAESKTIKAHFNMDESGMLLLDRVESVVETVIKENEVQPAFINLGHKISRLFGGRSSEPAANTTQPLQDEEEVPLESGNTTEEKKNGEKKAKTPKKTKVVSEDIAVDLVIRDIPNLTADEIASSKKRLQELMLRDLQKREREKILNSLEAFIFETHDQLYEYKQLVGGDGSSKEEDEQMMISGKLSEVSAWMDEDGYSATTKELREKLSELKSTCNAAFLRLDQERRQLRQGQGDSPSSSAGESKGGNRTEGGPPIGEASPENAAKSSNHSEHAQVTESTGSSEKTQSENPIVDEL